MNNEHDILEEYLQMRQSNAAREQADMSLLMRLRDELLEAKQTIREQAKIIQQQQQIIDEMKAARPIHNNINVGRDYIAEQRITTNPLRSYEQDN